VRSIAQEGSVSNVISWLERHPRTGDVLLAVVAFVVFGIVDAFRSAPDALVPDAIFAFALVFWRRSPPLALAIAWAGAVTQLITQPSVIFGNALIVVVVFATGLDERPVVRWLGFWSSIVGGVVAGVKLVLISDVLLPDNQAVAPNGSSRGLYFVAVSIVIASALALFWALGVATRNRRALSAERLERLESEQERLRAELRVAQESERTRITREMHDAIGHSLAVMIAQSDGARYALARDPDAASKALATINRSARGALDDVNALLNVLSTPGTGSRSLGLRDLDDLVVEMQSSGLNIELIESGDRRSLSTALDLAVYRVIQESLTNALKHGGAGTSVAIAIGWGHETVGLESVTTEPRHASGLVTASTSRSGHGIAGMRERLRLIGGTLEAGPRQDSINGFAVRARFPYEPGSE
jgi:signal transduction histidine kinase